MFRWYRLRKVHGLFLEACRDLEDGRIYWSQEPLRRSFLQFITPVPVLSLHEDGRLVYDGLQWLESNCRQHALGERVLQDYHRIVCGDRIENAGAYRKGDVSVKDSKVPRPSSLKVPLLMKVLDLKLDRAQARLDANKKHDYPELLRTAVEIHQQFEFIHPFADGNGRVGRLALNHVLRRYGYGYVILPPLSRSPEHFEALEEAHQGRLDRLVDFAGRHYHRI